MSTDAPENGELSIGLVGATGAVGTDLLAVLGKTSLPIGEVRLFASPESVGTLVKVRDKRQRVLALPSAASVPALFEGVDLAILAANAEVNRALAPALVAEGIAVIDIGANLADMAPLVVPAVSCEPLSGFAENRVICSPSAPAVVLSTVLAPLIRLGALNAHGTVLLSASAAGRAGTEELLGQVTALFNQRDPPRKIFPQGLAFDVNAQMGADAEGWTTVERRIALEISDVVGWVPDQALFDVALVSLFSGVCASVSVEFDSSVSPDDVRNTLSEMPGVQVVNPLPGPRRITGEATIYAGRVRSGPDTTRVHFWVVADNLRSGATANVLGIATALWSEGYL